MTETIHGPVDSPMTQFAQGLEAAMWACGVTPGQATEVLNLVMFGSRVPGPHGGIWPTPAWVKPMAERGMNQVVQDVSDRAEHQGGMFREQDVRLVILEMVRQALQEAPTVFDQVLGG